MWRSIEREVCATLNAGSWSCNHIKIFDKYSQVAGVHNFVPTIEKRVNKMCLLMILQDCWAFFLARPSRESSWPLFQVQHQFSAFSKSKMAAVGGFVLWLLLRRTALILSNRFLAYHSWKERETGESSPIREALEQFLAPQQIHSRITGELNFIEFRSHTKYQY